MKRLLIEALWNEKWAGGLYYIRNIMFSLSLNEFIKDNYSITILSYHGNEEVFDVFDKVKHIYIKPYHKRIDRIVDLIIRLQSGSDIVYPMTEKRRFMDSKAIAWIPDFQHKHFPEFFNSNILTYRDEKFKSYLHDRCSVVFSSQDSLKDFRDFYSESKREVYVIPFVSYIEPIIRGLSKEKEKKILRKFGVEHVDYTCVMNQFWQHKNHIVVFKALKEYLTRNANSQFQIIFTGNMEDYRNPDYIKSLKEIADDPVVTSNIKLLGFISREEQIALMKNAAFVIQPSLFEGWGTVVEDAKVLDKTILLSDIPVHREQMNEKCILFDPHDPVALAELIEQESKKEHHDDVEKGIADMYKRAKEYSKGFEQLLRDLETKK